MKVVEQTRGDSVKQFFQSQTGLKGSDENLFNGEMENKIFRNLLPF